MRSSSQKSSTWSDKGQNLLKNYLKLADRKSKTKGGIAILSSTGEHAWTEGRWPSSDWTSMGSLVSAWRATAEGLNSLLKVPGHRLIAGDKKNYWIAWNDQRWLVFGVHAPLLDRELKEIFSWLKKAPKSDSQRANMAEALSGLNEEGLDSVLKKGLR